MRVSDADHLFVERASPGTPQTWNPRVPDRTPRTWQYWPPKPDTRISLVRAENNSIPARLAGVQCKALNGSTPARNSWHSPTGRGGISIPQTTRFLSLGLPHDRHGSLVMKILRNSRAPRQKVLEVWFRRHPKIAGKTLRTPNDDTTSAVEEGRPVQPPPCSRPYAAAVSGAREVGPRCAPSTGRHRD
jgi:hypothetical protein